MSRILIIFFLVFVQACHQKQVENKTLNIKQALPFYTTADFTPRWIEVGSRDYDSIHTIPAFSFTDQNGSRVTEQSVAGKIYVADFFFTSCPGICPRLTKNLRLVQDAFINDGDIVLLSHSVTPDKDDVATLQHYAKNYGIVQNKWH